MKVKIAKNVILDGKVLKQDDVHDLPDKHGDILIKGGHAIAHREAPSPSPKSKKENPAGQTSPTGQTDAPEGEKDKK